MTEGTEVGINVAHGGRARGSCSWSVVGKGREEKDAQVSSEWEEGRP